LGSPAVPPTLPVQRGIPKKTWPNGSEQNCRLGKQTLQILVHHDVTCCSHVRIRMTRKYKSVLSQRPIHEAVRVSTCIGIAVGRSSFCGEVEGSGARKAQKRITSGLLVRKRITTQFFSESLKKDHTSPEKDHLHAHSATLGCNMMMMLVY